MAARARVNADLLGIVFCNGFAVHNMEGSKLTMAKNLDSVVWPTHKTDHHKGDLAKLFAPSALAAMQCYCKLPRREAVTTFFHSVGAGTAEVSIPGALFNFSKTYLLFPPESNRPGVNLLHKWYHTHLMSLTRTEDALLGVMQRIEVRDQRMRF